MILTASTDIARHRHLAAEQGKTLLEFHTDLVLREGHRILAELREQAGVELLSPAEIRAMVNALAEMEDNIAHMGTSELLTLIHGGFGRIDGLAATALLQVKRDGNFEIVRKLHKLLEQTQAETGSDEEPSTDPLDSPQLKNPELNNLIEELQRNLNSPEKLQEELSQVEVSEDERPEAHEKPEVPPAASPATEQPAPSEVVDPPAAVPPPQVVHLPELAVNGALSTLQLLEKLQRSEVDDRLSFSFLLEVARQVLWNQLCEDESSTLPLIQQKLAETTGPALKVVEQVLEEHRQVKAMPLPEGFNPFWKDDEGNALEPVMPFLMQRYEVWQLKQKASRLNLSDAGTGKTLAGVLASQALGSQLTVVFAPLSVIGVWERTFRNAFPNVEVQSRTWTPSWKTAGPRVLILNYDFLSTKAHNAIVRFAEQNHVNFVLLDEAHTCKQRGTTEILTPGDVPADGESVSARRIELQGLLMALRQRDREMRIYGLTASPAPNDLTEPLNMLSLIEPGRDVSGMDFTPNVANGLRAHQELTLLSTRWRQAEERKGYAINRQLIRVDASDYTEDLISLPNFHAMQLEQVSLEAKLPALRRILSDGEPTVIFVHHIDGIVSQLKRRLAQAGFSVGAYDGNDKGGLQKFLSGENQILIASMRAIGTGFDGLQNVSSRGIFFALPWTYELRKQCEARLARTGQRRPCTFITIEAFFEINDPRVKADDAIWSWDAEVARLIHSKREMADLVMDGQMPSLKRDSLEEQAQEGRRKWMARLEELGGITSTKRTITVPLVFRDEVEKQRMIARYGGDFSAMNARWNSSNGSTTFKRLQQDPAEWELYHTLDQENRQTWRVDPLQLAIAEMRGMEGTVIGDFGCGTAKLAAALGETAQVVSFDFVALNDDVVACNIAEGVPMPPNSLDVAVFSLSLMGRDWPEMLKAARRVMRPTGQLYIWNPKSKTTGAELRETVTAAGFRVIAVDESEQLAPFVKVVAVVKAGRVK